MSFALRRARMHARAHLRVNGRPGTYTPRGGAAIDGLKAAPGQTTFREERGERAGAAIVRSADWLFDPEEFRAAVGRWPQDGDLWTVETPFAGTTVATTYRVTPFNGESVYRLSPDGAFLRVHTAEQSVSEG